MLPTSALLTGTQINYYLICRTKLWLFSHFISMESSSELVQYGKFIHETSYEREKKEIIIDNKIGIDFIKQKDKLILHDIKKSRKLENAHKYQIYYYIYYMKEVKGLPDVDGILDYPLLRKRETLILTDDIKKEIESMLENIQKIIKEPQPPNPERKKYCPKCAYFEICWV